jgi:predicted nuclease of predicted toxin-antitoxin system
VKDSDIHRLVPSHGSNPECSEQSVSTKELRRLLLLQLQAEKEKVEPFLNDVLLKDEVSAD